MFKTFYVIFFIYVICLFILKLQRKNRRVYFVFFFTGEYFALILLFPRYLTLGISGIFPGCIFLPAWCPYFPAFWVLIDEQFWHETALFTFEQWTIDEFNFHIPGNFTRAHYFVVPSCSANLPFVMPLCRIVLQLNHFTPDSNIFTTNIANIQRLLHTSGLCPALRRI